MNNDTHHEAENSYEEESEQFVYHFDQLQCETETHSQYEFEFDFEKKSSCYDSFEGLRKFMNSWVNDLNALKLNMKESSKVFQLAADLVNELTTTNIGLFGDPECDMSAEHIANMSKDLIQSELSLYGTSYRYKKTVKSGSSYVHPKERAIGTRIEMNRDRGSSIAIPRTIQSICQYVPISESLCALFDNNQFASLYFKYNSEKHVCIDGQYTQFCCGDVYKQSEIFMSDPYTVQIQLFTDDYEPCSPLQSKAGVHKLCAVYFLIKNFPIQYQSRLNYINLVCLCHSDDINKSTQADFNNIWQIIVEDLSKLETEGILVGSRRIKAAICYPSFDNLGANISLGFAGSFSAEYYCRFCESNSSECKTACEENDSKIRTEENYENRLKVIESLEKIDYRRTFGLKRNCLLNELKYFHVTKNLSVDILHDIYEGAMPFVLSHIIEFMIATKILKKNEIVDLVSFYNFGEMNNRNVPSILGLGKTNLGQNGAQNRCLFTHFPFIFAKFQNNEKLKNVWNSMESLACVSQIVHSYDISTENLNELNESVYTLLNSIKVNFKASLIPKLHNLVHYVRVIKTMGPVVHMNAQRFESKHKVFKQLIGRSPNYRNICKTLAIRHQQHIAMSDFGLKDKISSGIRSLMTIDKCEDDYELINICLNNRGVYETKYFCYNNYKYKNRNMIINGNTLFQIRKILIIDEEFYFHCSTYVLLEFNSFYFAYKIHPKSPEEKTILKFDGLSSKAPYEIKTVGSEEFIIAETLDVRKCV